jgi:Tfp pilus assembly protein PilO
MPTDNKSKKVQVDKDKAKIFAIVSVAAVVSAAAFVIGKGLWDQAAYIGKVADKKEAAVEQLEENKESFKTLSAAYDSFKKESPNLLGDDPAGSSPRSGDNVTLVLDALPSKYDFPAVTSSIEKLLTGYTINSIVGKDDNVAQQTAASMGPIEIPFSVDVVTNYSSFRQLIYSFNKSIRPIQLVKIELSGTDGTLQAQLDAKTYFQPERGLVITESLVE